MGELIKSMPQFNIEEIQPGDCLEVTCTSYNSTFNPVCKVRGTYTSSSKANALVVDVQPLELTISYVAIPTHKTENCGDVRTFKIGIVDITSGKVVIRKMRAREMEAVE